MRIWTAHIRPRRGPVLVREGWSWGAFLFGPLWLLANGAWIPALLNAALFGALLIPEADPIRLPAWLGLLLLDGLMGRDMIRWSLGLRGYALAHVVLAPDRDAALARLYDARRDLLESAT